jgi:hypothetical protein
METWQWFLVGAVILTASAGVWVMTRGIRNNNPGNIRFNQDNDWVGQIGQDDAGFAVFDTPEHGIRALAITLKTYQNSYGLNTIDAIINRWAPPSENDTSAYIQSVAQSTGYMPDQPLNLNDAGTLANMVEAIIKHENGLQPYQLATINTGVSAA